MKPNKDCGILDLFDNLPENNPVHTRMLATPKSGDLGHALLKIPTSLPMPRDAEHVYVVHEVRSTWASVNRRVLGVFRSRDEAERTADESRSAITRILKHYNGVPHGRESCDGTMLEYWCAGNPLVIFGFGVEVEETTYCSGDEIS